MTKISRKRIPKESKIINDFWRATTCLKNKDEVREFLKSVLTPTEMLMLAKRVEVAKMLITDNHYDDIRRQVQVTNATISHIKDSLTRGGYKGYIVPLQRLERMDYKVVNNKRKKLAAVNIKRTTFSLELTKTLGKEGVKQYRKWRRVKSAKS
jgi:TrpR-related protein YerC/YecD